MHLGVNGTLMNYKIDFVERALRLYVCMCSTVHSGNVKCLRGDLKSKRCYEASGCNYWGHRDEQLQ